MSKKNVILILGIIIMVIAAVLMVDGSILGQRTISAAITLTMVGLATITCSKKLV